MTLVGNGIEMPLDEWRQYGWNDWRIEQETYVVVILILWLSDYPEWISIHGECIPEISPSMYSNARYIPISHNPHF